MSRDQPSPLVAIKQAEGEIAAGVAAAAKAAEVDVLEARQWAVECRDQADEEGRAEAAAYYREGLASADAEAARIEAEGERRAAQIVRQAEPLMERLVENMLAIVLPRVVGATGPSIPRIAEAAAAARVSEPGPGADGVPVCS